MQTNPVADFDLPNRSGDVSARLQSAANDATAAPTPAQAIAGNYRKGRVTLHGLKIAIENARGSVREGTSLDGTRWSNRMAAHYGDFPGTVGADGDAVDVFVGLFPESTQVWVINQRHVGGPRVGFDEHKVMLGFTSEQQAVDAYTDSFDRGWRGLASIVSASLSQLKWWLANGDMSQPLSTDQLPFEGTPMLDKVLWDSSALPATIEMHKLVYALRLHDKDDGFLLDAVTMADLMGHPDIEERPVFDALVVQVARMQSKMDMLMRVMDAANQGVKPVAVSISDPVRARGVMQVMVLFEMSDGQTVSVWFHNPDTTPAKLTPMDELISWKWMLNKMDVTIVVAPERGQDLNVREVARRVMRLVERNSQAFAKANAKLAERMAETEAVKAEIVVLEAELAKLDRQIEVARQVKADELATGQLTFSAESGSDIVLSGKELGEFPDGAEGYKAMQKAAMDYFDTQLIGKTQFNASLNADVYIRRSGAKKIAKLGSSRLKMKLIPATLNLLKTAVKQSSKASTAPEEHNIKAYHYLSVEAKVAEQTAKIWMIVKEDDKGMFLYEEFVNKGALAGIAGVASALDSAALDGPALYQGSDYFKPEGQNTASDGILDAVDGDMVLNLFIEGETEEEPAVPETPVAPTVEQIEQAEVLGRKAGADVTAPAQDAEFMRMIPPGVPVGWSLPLLNAWLRGQVAASAEAAVAVESLAASRLGGLDGFADDLNPIQKTRVLDTLNKVVIRNGKSQPVKDLIRELVGAGWDVWTNRTYGRVIQAPEPDGSFIEQKRITKIGLDFAAYLIAKRNAEQAADEPTAVAAVDAAYQFSNATDAFKESIASSIADEDYSPFKSAMVMDKAAIAAGMSVAWGLNVSGVTDGIANTDRQAVLDGAAAAAASYIPGGVILDFAGDVPAAVAQLRVALDVVTTNEPINRAEGNNEQADLERENAAQFREAIAILAGPSLVLDAADDKNNTPSAGDVVEFKDDRHTDKGPATGVIEEAKITPDGQVVTVKFGDEQQTFSWDDLGVCKGKTVDGKCLWMVGDKAVLDAANVVMKPELILDAVPMCDVEGVITKGGAVVGRVGIALGDGKALIFVGAEGDERVKPTDGDYTFRFTEDEESQVAMVQALAASLVSATTLPKDGDTRTDEDGAALVFKDGQWGKWVAADESGELPPAFVPMSAPTTEPEKPAVTIEPAADPAEAVDRAYLESLIDGTGDLLAADTFERLEPLFAKYAEGTEMYALLEKAATVYGDAAVAVAQKALAPA